MAGTGCDAVPVENAANRLVVSTFDYEGDDTDPAINPAAADEICDGVDDNCDGTPDDEYVPSATSCGVGECADTGTLTCESGAASFRARSRTAVRCSSAPVRCMPPSARRGRLSRRPA